jgi:vanillate O-demethylase ferredoxin subunit
MAFLDALATRHGDALCVHADDEPGTQLPLAGLLDAFDPGQHLYVCGPKGLIDAVIELSHGRHWPHGHVHFELFTPPAPQAGDRGCRRGECGDCQAVVLEGKPDHRDYYLSDEERDAGNVMQICVSRCHTDRLVLDL